MTENSDHRQRDKERRARRRRTFLSVSSWGTAMTAVVGYIGLWHYLSQTPVQASAATHKHAAATVQRTAGDSSTGNGNGGSDDGAGSSDLSGGSTGQQGSAGISQSQVPDLTTSAS